MSLRKVSALVTQLNGVDLQAGNWLMDLVKALRECFFGSNKQVTPGEGEEEGERVFN